MLLSQGPWQHAASLPCPYTLRRRHLAPCRPPELRSIDQYFDAEGDELPPGANPFGWVPVAADAMETVVRPGSGQIQTRSATVLPLEYYDNPEMELLPPEKKLQTVG